jgi:hypothetical protein
MGNRASIENSRENAVVPSLLQLHSLSVIVIVCLSPLPSISFMEDHPLIRITAEFEFGRNLLARFCLTSEVIEEVIIPNDLISHLQDRGMRDLDNLDQAALNSADGDDDDFQAERFRKAFAHVDSHLKALGADAVKLSVEWILTEDAARGIYESISDDWALSEDDGEGVALSTYLEHAYTMLVKIGMDGCEGYDATYYGPPSLITWEEFRRSVLSGYIFLEPYKICEAKKSLSAISEEELEAVAQFVKGESWSTICKGSRSLFYSLERWSECWDVFRLYEINSIKTYLLRDNSCGEHWVISPNHPIQLSKVERFFSESWVRDVWSHCFLLWRNESDGDAILDGSLVIHSKKWLPKAVVELFIFKYAWYWRNKPISKDELRPLISEIYREDGDASIAVD